MSTKEFIINYMLDISKHINGINLRFAFDEISNYNIIEVSPESIRRGNKEYMELEANFWKDFHFNFPMDNILISSVDEFNDMSNLIFEAEGHNEISIVNNFNTVSYSIQTNINNNTYINMSNYYLAA